MTTHTDTNQTFDPDGNVVAGQEVEVDITEEHNASIIDLAITDALDDYGPSSPPPPCRRSPTAP